jgi:hypothetical protein
MDSLRVDTSSQSHSDPVAAAKLAAASIMSPASLGPAFRNCMAVSIAYCRNADGENFSNAGWFWLSVSRLEGHRIQVNEQFRSSPNPIPLYDRC